MAMLIKKKAGYQPSLPRLALYHHMTHMLDDMSRLAWPHLHKTITPFGRRAQMLSRRHASDGWTPRRAHAYAFIHPHMHKHLYLYLSMCASIHTHRHTHATSKTPPDGASSQGETINQLQVCLGLTPMLCYYDAMDQAWERIKYIRRMQILSDGMTGRPSQSFRYVYHSLLWRLCDYSGLCATEGQRDNSFDMRYVLMRRQWVLTVHAVYYICVCAHMCVCRCGVVASGPWLFDVCINPAAMTVAAAAAGWVSGELIISVCHLWRGWSCDTGNNYTVSLFLMWAPKMYECVCAKNLLEVLCI